MRTVSEKNGNTLVFVEEDGKHYYELNGILVPGCTDVKSAYPKAVQLIKWEVGMGAEFVIDALHGTKKWPITKKRRDELVKGAKTATKAKLDDTADVGTLTHDYCHALRTGRMFDMSLIKGHKDEETLLRRFKEVDEWVKEREAEETVVAAEEIVGSPCYQFAGKFDVLVRRKDTGKLRLQDYKSAKGFYIDQFIQEGGYRQAILEWKGWEVDELEVIRFNDNTERPAALAITTDVQDFTDEFLICRQTRTFQRKWDSVFNALYKASLPKRRKKNAN